MPQPLLSHLRVVQAGPNRYLQHLTLDAIHNAPQWLTLRPIRFDPTDPADPLPPLAVLVGTPDSYEMYDLHLLLTTLLSPASAFDIDEAMPDPMPMPDPMRYLSDLTTAVLVRGALGHSTLDIEAYVKGVDSAVEVFELRNDWESSDIHLLKSSDAQPYIERVQATHKQAIEEAIKAAPTTPLPADPITPPSSSSADPTNDATLSPSANLPYGQTRRLTPEQLAVYERRLKGDINARRLRWPYSKMEVGDVVRIEATLAAKGQRAAHAYAAASGKIFSTTRLRNGDLEVVRISGFRMPSVSKRT